MVSAADTLSPCYCTPSLDTARARRDCENSSNGSKILKLIEIKGSRNYFQRLCSPITLLFNQLFSEYSPTINGFLVGPSTEYQW